MAEVVREEAIEDRIGIALGIVEDEGHTVDGNIRLVTLLVATP